ncbi:VIT domain-containing protein [Streptosporangium sandarakinum]|uniref:VIT domain-containing protein n=1 Tax=Streptosporangium sandarakinum TaxID=1260955 RepID=UPI0033BA9290
MISSIGTLSPEEYAPVPDAGLGALATERGNLPLESVDVTAAVSGLVAGAEVTQVFRNPHDVALEATYVFPLPDRAAVTAFRMEADGRVVEGVLKERGQARADYDRALAEGRRAAIAEEDRPDVFTIRVGNIVPGERVTVRLTLSQPLPYEDGAATFRFPLVVAPRYIPGAPLDGERAGDGRSPDTDAVPDASRITPPVLLPGFPAPVRLSLAVTVDPAGLELREIRSSLHAVLREDGGEGVTVGLRPGERLDRDFVLRLAFDASTSLTLVPDQAGAAPGARETSAGADGTGAEAAGRVPGAGETPSGTTGAAGRVPGAGGTPSGTAGAAEPAGGTFTLTVVPGPAPAATGSKDVVLVLDRSGSMGGWKMVAARRAAARIVDTLTDGDRFAVLSFDHVVERPAGLGEGLVEATDRNRYRAVEHLARLEARGGTEMLAPLEEAVALLNGRPGPMSPGRPGAPGDPARTADTVPSGGPAGPADRVLVLVTDGQVGNEDQILERIGGGLAGTRVHTVGIDRAVNAGFLGRLAGLGAGRCELVESEDRLDEAMEHIHRRIAAPLVTDLSLEADGLSLVPDTTGRLGSIHHGVPLTVHGRYRGDAAGALTVRGLDAAGRPWERRVTGVRGSNPAVRAIWARARLRELEDRYAAGDRSLEEEIVATSLGYGVLCRFTAFVAVDSRVVAEGGPEHRVIQPVEPPSGWAGSGGAPMAMMQAATPMMPVAAAGPMPAPGAPAPSGPPPGFGGPAPAFAPAPGFARAAKAPASRVSGTARPSETLRVRLGEELERLRAAESLPAAAKLRYLDDLGSRLAALAAYLGGHTGLTALAEELQAAGDPDALWRRAVEVLSALRDAAGPGGPGEPGVTGGSGEPGRRRPFWKR